MLIKRTMSREEDFDGYRIVQRIGSGGAGTVFAAQHGKLRRQVAIKILHPHLVGDGSEQRMLAEAHTLSLLDHPGIVKVFDVGTTADGRVYVVMEHLVGEPLHVRLCRTHLPEDCVVRFGRQLASALEVAHAAGVVHRDLKPENVFIVEDPDLPGGERVKLIDFGIAKREGHARTETGIVLGTPAYMAPEQFRGCRSVDPRADIYSLGVVLYVMATGERPFSGRNTGEMLAEHAYCRPPSASEVSSVSPGLSAIIERCLAKRPEDRFATMGELGAALSALEGGQDDDDEVETIALVASSFDDDDDDGDGDGDGAKAAGAGELDAMKICGAGELDDMTTMSAVRPKMFGANPISCLISLAQLRASEQLLARGSERLLGFSPAPLLARGSERLLTPTSAFAPQLALSPLLAPAPLLAPEAPLVLAPEAPLVLAPELAPPLPLELELPPMLAPEPPLVLEPAPELAPAPALPAGRVDWRSLRGPFALVAAAGVVIALGYGLRSGRVSSATGGAAAAAAAAAAASTAAAAAIDVATLETMLRDADAPSAAPPRAGKPAKATRTNARRPATSRKPAQERTAASVTAPAP